jgi:hypothetical protein
LLSKREQACPRTTTQDHCKYTMLGRHSVTLNFGFGKLS